MMFKIFNKTLFEIIAKADIYQSKISSLEIAALLKVLNNTFIFINNLFVNKPLPDRGLCCVKLLH